MCKRLTLCVRVVARFTRAVKGARHCRRSEMLLETRAATMKVSSEGDLYDRQQNGRAEGPRSAVSRLWSEGTAPVGLQQLCGRLARLEARRPLAADAPCGP
jgi:hypothetical protein